MKTCTLPASSPFSYALAGAFMLGLALPLGTLAAEAPAIRDIRPAPVFTTGMVIQRDRPIPVWGTAQPGMTVKVSFAGQARTATAAADAGWLVMFDALPANDQGQGMQFDYLAAAGSDESLFPDTVERNDILIGDVWYCAGQSNMEFGISAMETRSEELKDCKYPKIRYYLVPKSASPVPTSELFGHWEPFARANLTSGGWNGFSAIAFVFGRKLWQETKVPIGLIQAAYGGSPIEGWIGLPEMAASPILAPWNQQIIDAETGFSNERKSNPDAVHPWANITDTAQLKPATIYRAMIQPFAPLRIRGVLWYQGETNVGSGPSYTDKMGALIATFRRIFADGVLPFYFVELAPWNYGGSLPSMWQSQEDALAIPHTAMATTVDVGDATDIHPKRKREVGERLALIALADAYGRKELLSEGPVFRSAKASGDNLVLDFANAGTGLKTSDGKGVRGFELSADGGSFMPAQATVAAATVTLSAAGLKAPRFVRYAWQDVPDVNLVGATGLPARPFNRRAGP